MTKSTKLQPASAATLDEFRGAVKYLLIHQHGMPELAANDVLTIDADYIAKAFADPGNRTAIVAEVALELVGDGETKSGWVRRDGDAAVIDMNRQIKAHVDKLANTGLYGNDANEVALTMMCRGIESVLSTLPDLARLMKPQ
jgi:hypothetical protein